MADVVVEMEALSARWGGAGPRLQPPQTSRLPAPSPGAASSSETLPTAASLFPSLLPAPLCPTCSQDARCDSAAHHFRSWSGAPGQVSHILGLSQVGQACPPSQGPGWGTGWGKGGSQACPWGPGSRDLCPPKAETQQRSRCDRGWVGRWLWPGTQGAAEVGGCPCGRGSGAHHPSWLHEVGHAWLSPRHTAPGPMPRPRPQAHSAPLHAETQAPLQLHLCVFHILSPSYPWPLQGSRLPPASGSPPVRQ